MPRSLPEATIFICDTSAAIISSTLVWSWSLLLTGSEIACAISSATTKSVSTCSSSASKWDAVAGIGKSSISSTGMGCSQLIGSGADFISPVSSQGTMTWHVAFPSPLTANASLPTTTNAAFSSTPIAGVVGLSWRILSASSSLPTPFVPALSKWGMHTASTNPSADIFV